MGCASVRPRHARMPSRRRQQHCAIRRLGGRLKRRAPLPDFSGGRSLLASPLRHDTVAPWPKGSTILGRTRPMRTTAELSRREGHTKRRHARPSRLTTSTSPLGLHGPLCRASLREPPHAAMPAWCRPHQRPARALATVFAAGDQHSHRGRLRSAQGSNLAPSGAQPWPPARSLGLRTLGTR